MRLGVVPEKPVEWVALRLGGVPTPVAEVVFAMMLSRSLMAGVHLGVFATLEQGPLAVRELAARTGADPAGIDALAEALLASGYLIRRSGRLGNSRAASRWLVPSSAHYLGNLLTFNYDHWEWWSRLEECVRHGKEIDLHQEPRTEDGLRRYVLAMRDLALLAVPEIVGTIPVPGNATYLLDVGASHGAYSVALCRRHSALAATLLDLEPVARICRPIVEGEGLGDRIAYRSGDALRDDLGEGHDLVLLFQVLHHFPAEDARAVLRRVAAAMKPGGTLALLEPARGPRADQMAALLHLHYLLTSRGGVPTRIEKECWLREAGFGRVRVHRMRTAPGLELTLALKGR